MSVSGNQGIRPRESIYDLRWFDFAHHKFTIYDLFLCVLSVALTIDYLQLTIDYFFVVFVPFAVQLSSGFKGSFQGTFANLRRGYCIGGGMCV
jgi:hypothetical protein